VVAGIEPKKGGVLAGRSPALPGAIETKILKLKKKSVSEFQNHFDKYCFAGKKQVRFRLGIGSDDGVGQMKSYKQQQDSRIIKENTLHIVYIF
jgi:hypothetical protein